MATTGRFSISHDTLARAIFNNEFLTANPDFEPIRETLEQCKQTYHDEVKKQGCSCRVDGSWSAPCLDLMLPMLEQANKTNHDMVRRFVRFVSKKPPEVDIDGLGVNILYGDKTYSIFIDKEPQQTETAE